MIFKRLKTILLVKKCFVRSQKSDEELERISMKIRFNVKVIKLYLHIFNAVREIRKKYLKPKFTCNPKYAKIIAAAEPYHGLYAV